MAGKVAPDGGAVDAVDAYSARGGGGAPRRWRRAVRACAELAEDVDDMNSETGLRFRLVVVSVVVTVFIFVGEQFVWVTPSGRPIGLKWLIYLGTWAVLYTLAYEAVALAAARSVAEDHARGVALGDDSKDLARAAVLMRALINPLGLVGCASWLTFVKGSDEGELRHRALWEVISFIKHVGPEAAFLFDVYIRPRPMLKVADAGVALFIPFSYASFLVAYYHAGGTNYENERLLYAELDNWKTILAAGALWVLSVPVCVLAHRAYMELVVKHTKPANLNLSKRQIKDIERDIADGFIQESTDDILNGWTSSKPRPADPGAAADPEPRSADEKVAEPEDETRAPPEEDAADPAPAADAAPVDDPAPAETPTAATAPVFGDGTPHGAQLPPLAR